MGRVGIPDVTVQVPAHEHVQANGSKMDPFALDSKWIYYTSYENSDRHTSAQSNVGLRTDILMFRISL
jgi:hypothetical protein